MVFSKRLNMKVRKHHGINIPCFANPTELHNSIALSEDGTEKNKI